jgi:hypothetical protein
LFVQNLVLCVDIVWGVGGGGREGKKCEINKGKNCDRLLSIICPSPTTCGEYFRWSVQRQQINNIHASLTLAPKVLPTDNDLVDPRRICWGTVAVKRPTTRWRDAAAIMVFNFLASGLLVPRRLRSLGTFWISFFGGRVIVGVRFKSN